MGYYVRALCACILAMATAAMTCGSLCLVAAEPSARSASLRVQSVNVSRNTTALKSRFPNRYLGDNNPVVSLQLLLTLKEGFMLPLDRDAVTIDTFVDDTYQNLLSTGNDSSYYNANNLRDLSEDSQSLLFTVATSRFPAEDAGRVFVRGSVQARVSRAEPKLASSPMALTVGHGAMVGPFRTVTRSVSDVGGGTSGAQSVTLSIEGDAQRVRKIRILDGAGKVLNDERQSRLGGIESASRSVSAYLRLRSLPSEPVTIEYTYLEATEIVRIPFEAQVDIGVAKAGPIEPSDGTKPTSAVRERAWPPPLEAPDERIPQRRPPFKPESGQIAKVEGAAIDLFSLTVAKPAPAEAEGVKWNCPPGPEIYARGFTVARLMLSTPGASIISIPPDGVSVTRFEDDKGGRLATTLYRDASSSSWSYPYARLASGGEQMLLNLSLASAPTPGATRCSLAGSVQVRIGRGNLASATAKLDLSKNRSFTAGPFSGELGEVRQIPPLTPATQAGRELEVWLALNGPVSRVRAIALEDGTGAILNLNRTGFVQFPPERADSVSYALRLTAAPSGPVTLRIHHYESEETIEVPFDLNVGVGL